MLKAKALFKLLVFLGITLFFYFLIMVSALLSLVGVNYEKNRGHLLRAWGNTACSVLGIRVEVKGRAPEPPFFLVSNHLSYTDVFVLFSQVRGLFVAKADVQSWPVIGPIIKSCGILFIDRERKRDINRVNELIRENINDRQGVIIFPESTTSNGKQVLPFRSSLLHIPAREGYAVSYAHIHYASDDPGVNDSEILCWWDDIPFFVHFLKLLELSSVKATVTFGKEEVLASDRKELSRQLEENIRKIHMPVAG